MNEENPEVQESQVRFEDLGLSEPLMRSVRDVGYEQPTPIQAAGIPPLLEGRDLVGVAQTGTGKTAAFVLPLLSSLELSVAAPQILVLTPTRELAIQVAEAAKTYGRYLEGFRILPVYGGQGMDLQLRQLHRGVHMVVGTPGRVLDHLRRGTLRLGQITSVVLDEADEMLRMGFLDEVTEILDQAPVERRTALFSATMPSAIRKVAANYLSRPVEIRIKSRTTTVETVNQRYWQVRGVSKLDALTRILEAEEIDAMLVFARTKIASAELAEKIEARGYAAAALNGDMNQAQRERTVERLKSGKIDVLIATDVAARGLDVSRISHVLNYDIPYDTESYVHRIGRTGRAGRTGEAILFVRHRERRLLHTIEKATRQKILPMDLPTRADVSARRVEKFKLEVAEALEDEGLDLFVELVQEFQKEQGVEIERLAAAMACLAQREKPLDLGFEPESEPKHFDPTNQEGGDDRLVTYRVEVGRRHGVMPGNLVGAITNEAGLASRYIGRIDLQDEFSHVDMPGGMPRDIMKHLRDVEVCGCPLLIRRVEDDELAEYRSGSSRGGSRPGRSGRREFRSGPPRTGTPRPRKHSRAARHQDRHSRFGPSKR